MIELIAGVVIGLVLVGVGIYYFAKANPKKTKAFTDAVKDDLKK